jgi:hypothetical protein
MPRRRTPFEYWLIDWPRFLAGSAAAWYYSLVGVAGVLLLISTVAIAGAYAFGIRLGW